MISLKPDFIKAFLISSLFSLSITSPIAIFSSIVAFIRKASEVNMLVISPSINSVPMDIPSTNILPESGLWIPSIKSQGSLSLPDLPAGL